MSLSRYVNALLSHFDIALTRRSTLDRVMSNLPGEVRIHGLLASVKGGAAHTAGSLRRVDENELLRHQIALKWELIDLLERLTNKNPPLRQCSLCGYESEAEKFVNLEAYCVFGGGTLARHQCPSCDVIFGADKMFRLSSKELSQDYEWHYRVYSESDSTDQEIRAFHALKPSRRGKYLNYGAGAWSRSTHILRSEGWDVYAFEPHASASNDTQHVFSDRSILSAMRFDGIFSNNVLEHLRHPIDELIFMRDLLQPGGKMAHATPCFEYLYEYTRFHLFFFLGRSRQLLADKADLAVCDFTKEGEFMVCLLKPIQE